MRKLFEKLGWIKKDTDVVISMGDCLVFESYIHNSVGRWYELDYDTIAFTESRSYKYVNPSYEVIQNEGGDKQIVKIILKALKTGLFNIVEIENFRGKRTVQKIHRIRVK